MALPFQNHCILIIKLQQVIINMPKMKTKSSAKKRFSFTATGKVRSPQANKRHNMRKRSKRQLREQRGSTILNAVEARRVTNYFPYGQ